MEAESRLAVLSPGRNPIECQGLTVYPLPGIAGPPMFARLVT